MKVVSAKQMQRIESQAFHDGASETEFMEEAGSGVALVVHEFSEKYHVDKHIILLCGKGNNAGDAYVTGINLLRLDYIVTAYQLFPIEECSTLCRQQYSYFINNGGRVEQIEKAESMQFPPSGVIVDGIFGTGFHGSVDEPVASVIHAANQSGLPIISIDIPSGLNGETGQSAASTIIAKKTAFLELPKTGFFLKDGWNHVGVLEHIQFGLGKDYIDASEADMIMLSPDVLSPLMPHIERNRNKYQAGYVVGLAGSPGMPGAAQLASLAALRGGAGIVKLLYPEGMEADLSSSPYELIRVPYDLENPSQVIEFMNKASAVFIGPGLGLADKTKKFLHDVVPKITVPCVIDADALNTLAERDYSLPDQCVLTPHLGELKRLMHITSAEISMEFLSKCQAYAVEKNATLILKGGPTFIFHPHEQVVVNPRGDPGMATAGSGDVLTGLIAALLAQGLTPKHAAYLGTYLHGVAGEFASEDMTPYCMAASDIINFFPDAFLPSNW